MNPVWFFGKIDILLISYFFKNLSMQVRIKTSHATPPEYKTPGACAFDFQASEEVTFAPGEWKLVEHYEDGRVELYNLTRDRSEARDVSREQGAVASALGALRRAAVGKGNLFPLILAAVSHRCTLGEISDTLRDAFGEYKAVQAL